MTTHFVDSAAAGANDGTSWTDAWTSIGSSTGVAAGDIVKVDDGHSQTSASVFNWSNGTVLNPVRIICVDKNNSDALSVGAAVTFSGSGHGPAGNIESYGMYWINSAVSAGLLMGAPTNGRQFHANGKCSATNTGQINFSGSRALYELRNQEVDFSGAGTSSVIACPSNGIIRWLGGILRIRTGGQTSLISTNAIPMLLEFRGVEFIGTTTNIFSGGASHASGRVIIADCVAPTYTNLIGTTPTHFSSRLETERFVAGTLTVPAIAPTQIYDWPGTVIASLSRYRTGGADDGEQANAYSWEMASDAEAAEAAATLMSPPITRWVEAGSQTLTIYIASGVTLQDDELWVDVISPSEAGSATAQGQFNTSRALPLATPANLTTDGSSTWNGAGVGTKQKIDVAINPTIAGPVTVRVHLAKPSTTVYVDPKLGVA